MEYTQTQSTSTSIAWQYKHNVIVTPKGLIIKQVIGTTASTSQNPQFNQILTMQLFEDWSNTIKLGSKKYDQSVTYLADDPWNLETRSSTLRTTGTLPQSNKHTIITQLEARVKLK